MNINQAEQLIGLVIDLESASNEATAATIYWNTVKNILPGGYMPGRDRVVDDLYSNMVETKNKRDTAWTAFTTANKKYTSHE